MSLNIVRCDQVEPTPWRNGGGRTRELLAWPQAQDWNLRISVADIERDGPFSPYPNVERWFAVVEGAGVRLKVDHALHVLQADSAPLHFRGEDAPGCELLDGPTRDLNLMHVRGQGQAAMQRAEPKVEFNTGATLRALFCADAVTLHVDGSEPLALPPFTLAWADGGMRGAWRLRGSGPRPRAWWMAFDTVAA